MRRIPAAVRSLSLEPLLGPVPSLQLSGIDWVIVSGERGSAHSPRLPSPQRCDARPEPARVRTGGTPAVPSGDNAVPPGSKRRRIPS
ncbi:phage Gp37/Gp68 family protein [Streptomyces canus]|nr:DUF5131 family protein [Streptomyces canus]